MGDDAGRFWDNVKEEIKRQNTTQDWVAKKAGISFNTFQGWISKGIYPRLNEGVRIAGTLNTTIEFLVSGSVSDHAAAAASVRGHIALIREELAGIESRLREME
ncbi:MAG: helix-turn-helix transcriptional regulator [Treponematales bacterium]